MTNEDYMKEAIAEARKGIEAGDGGPFGAVIVKDGVILGKGHNEVVKRNDPTCHGEMMAIRAACKKLGSFDLSGSVLYTTGYPCPMCLGAILWANIAKVYYGCGLADTDKIGFRDSAFYRASQSDKSFLEEVDRPDCLALYERYRSLSDKKAY